MGDALKMMESYMTQESVEKAHKKAEQEILAIKLAQLREQNNLTQQKVPNFSQSSVSRLEKRKDMKISTLVEYLKSLGMGLEIKAYSKNPNATVHEEVLLRV